MIKLLAKLFIKNNKDYSKPEVRTAYGMLCGSFGIFLNILLFAGKLTAGLIAKSVAMTADAFNNLSDAASSVVQLFGFKLSSKKPDPEHPFGHGRMEYISGLIISFLILLMGFELLKSSIDSVRHPETVSFNILSICIMSASIIVKIYMYIYNHSIGKKINSVSLEAVAKDSLSDTISTFVVIASALLSPYTTLPVDGIAGIIVAGFILYAGYESAKETIEPLLGAAPELEFVKAIEEELMTHKPIIAMHDLVVHDYGPGRLMVSLHAEVPGDQNIFELHDVIDNAEVDIASKFNCHVVIHMDPIDSNNERLSELKKFLHENLKTIHPDLNCHDVRMVPGKTHTNLIFDVVKPFGCKLTDKELKNQITNLVRKDNKDIFCVITVDQPFVS